EWVVLPFQEGKRAWEKIVCFIQQDSPGVGVITSLKYPDSEVKMKKGSAFPPDGVRTSVPVVVNGQIMSQTGQIFFATDSIAFEMLDPENWTENEAETLRSAVETLNRTKAPIVTTCSRVVSETGEELERISFVFDTSQISVTDVLEKEVPLFRITKAGTLKS